MNLSSRPKRLKAAQAAAYLGVHIRTLENWRCKGAGPAFVRVGVRGIRYEILELENFLKASKK